MRKGTKGNKPKASQAKGKIDRDAIPEAVKREVRQRCGFGCVFCGLPFYDYEHMEEWATVKRHVASEMTLLCPNHHREKTNGRISKLDLEMANRHPINLQAEMSPYPFRPHSSSVVVRTGGNSFFYDTSSDTGMIVLSIRSEPIIWFNFQDGNLLLNLSLYDRKGKQVVQIRDNQLVYSTDAWDITFVGKTLRIQAEARDTLLELTIDPNENTISLNNGKLRFAGYEVLIDKGGFNMPASVNGFSDCLVSGAGHLLNYGDTCNSAAINLPGTKSY